MPAPTDPPFADDAAGAPSGLSRRRLLTGAALTAAAGLAARPAVASAAPRVAAGPGAALRAAGDAAAVRVVWRVPPVPAAQPVALARHPAEDQGQRLQRGVHVLQLELPLPRVGCLRFHRRPRHGPGDADGRGHRDLCPRPARPVHQRRGERGRVPGLAHRHSRGGPDRRPGVPGRRRPVAHRDRRDPRPAPGDRRLRDHAAVPDRERVRQQRGPAHGRQLPGSPVREGPRRRHHRADLPQ